MNQLIKLGYNISEVISVRRFIGLGLIFLGILGVILPILPGWAFIILGLKLVFGRHVKVT